MGKKETWSTTTRKPDGSSNTKTYQGSRDIFGIRSGRLVSETTRSKDGSSVTRKTK